MRPMTRGERLAAWILTGPAGHLVAGLTDLAVAICRYWTARLRGQDAA